MDTVKGVRVGLLFLLIGTLLAGALLVWRVGSAGSDAPAPVVRDPDLASVVADFTSKLTPEASYERPSAPKRTAAELLEGSSPPGFSVHQGTDPASGRRYVLAVSNRGYGMYLLDLSEPLRLAIEVPHAASDLGTEGIGLDLWRKTPGSMLLVTGTHRRVVDVAHADDTVFHALAVQLADRDIPQVQLHGFHDDSLPTADVVVSPGSASVNGVVRDVARAFDDTGFDTCRGWQSTCGKLEGTRNVQGKACAAVDSTFLHIELSRSVRDARADDVVSALARVF